MQRKTRSSSRLDERLEDVERRLREVRRTVRAVERGRATPSRPPARAAPPRAAAEPAAAAAAAPAGARAEESAPGAALRAAPDERSRFQRYYAHASFPAGAVGRRDRRVLRNKAIAVAIGAIFLAMLIYLAFF